MYFEIENIRLAQAADFLYLIPLKGKSSRQRSKFINKLETFRKEFVEADEIIIKEHAFLDENGLPKKTIIDGKEVWDVKDREAFEKERDELFKEKRIIDGKDNEGMLKAVKKILDNYDKELSGLEGFIYDYLCDRFEEMEEREQSKGEDE